MKSGKSLDYNGLSLISTSFLFGLTLSLPFKE